MTSPQPSAPRSAIVLVLALGALHVAFLATQLATSSGTLLITQAVGPPIAAIALFLLWGALRPEHAPSRVLELVQVRLGGATGLVIVGAGASYVLGTGWLMAKVSYDVWGAFVVAPFIAFIAIRAVRKILPGDLARLRRAAMVGLAAKAVGTAARYWIANDVYGGAADATSYHFIGKRYAGQLYTGKKSLLEIVPHSQGTKFIEELTGLLYSMVGSSRLAGFFWFSLLGYVGVLLIVGAAARVLPNAHKQRYAWLCFLMPSLVYWPSSVGKEAWLSFTLGLVSFGAAAIWRGRVRGGVVFVAMGALGAAMVRPHMALMFLSGLVIASVVAVGSRRFNIDNVRRRGTYVVILVLGIAALAFVGRLTLQFLTAAKDDTSTASVTRTVGDIINEVGRRTDGGGSAFNPVEISGPTDYPEAVVRTLTRPLLYEANSFATLIPAVEMTFFVVLCAASWRRLVRAPKQMLTSPFVMFAFSICIMFGLVWASFSNMAILVRQRSLVMPFLLLLPCLPVLSAPRTAPAHDSRPLWVAASA